MTPVGVALALAAGFSLPGCTSPAGTPSTDRPGGDLRQDVVATASACAATCCGDDDCVGWVFAAKAPGDFGICTKGASCCYLKSTLSPPRANACCSAAAVSRQTTPINVSIDASRAFARTSPSLVSFNLDWHKNNEEFPAWSHNASAMEIDLASPRLRAAVAALAPAYLRVGGSEGDKIIYDVAGDGCGAKSGAPQPVDPAFCLSMARWHALVGFAADCGVSLVLGLNAMSFRANDTSPLDLSNIDAFLNYTAAARLRVGGFELGNELPKVPPAVCAQDYLHLAALLERHWPDNATRPKLIGNDLNSDETYVRAFLPVVGGALDVLTYHNYAGEGANHTQLSAFTTPEYLDLGPRQAHGVIQAWSELAAPGTEIWVGEIAACWHSGQQGWTDRFGDLFWYLDALAARAALNHSAFCRQALVGGYYEMLDRATLVPNPDFWGALLFKQLMGPTVLEAHVGAGSPLLRAWAQCQSPGVVTLLLINLSNDTVFQVPVEGLGLPGVASATRFDYELHVSDDTADALSSRNVSLNGAPLQPGPEGEIPSLSQYAKSSRSPSIVVKAHTLRFVVFEGVAAKPCFPPPSAPTPVEAEAPGIEGETPRVEQPSAAKAASTYPPPPVYNISASSLRDAGLQQGRLARARIRGWLAAPEMVSLINYTRHEGAAAFGHLKADNAAFSPPLARELEGIAEGAGVPLDSVWTATMINELESLRNFPSSVRRAGHCSDLYAHTATAGHVAHGHNEDWPGPVASFWYIAAYTALPGADFSSCAGVVYPGGLIGWAASWNEHGLYLTQNSLFPTANTAGGLSSAFAQRAALCGLGGAGRSPRQLDALITALKPADRSWSSAASLNLVSLTERRMANVEVHLDRRSAYEVTSNYSHFNMFKHLEVGTADGPEPSTLHRQARVDALPAVRSLDDIAQRLSDRHDATWPIYRNMTLHTLLVDSESGHLHGWCCGAPATSGEPVYRFHLPSFFEKGGSHVVPVLVGLS